MPIKGDNVKEWVTARRLNGKRYKSFYRYLSDPVCGSLEGIILVHGRDDIHLDEFGVLDGLAYGLGGDVLDGVRSRFGRLRGILEIRYSGLLVPESIYQSVADLSGDENVLGLLHTRYRGSFLYRGGDKGWRSFYGDVLSLFEVGEERGYRFSGYSVDDEYEGILGGTFNEVYNLAKSCMVEQGL